MRAAFALQAAAAARAPGRGSAPDDRPPLAAARAHRSAARARAGFLLPLVSPGQYKEGTYLDRLEAQRTAYQHVEGASAGVGKHLRSWWGIHY